MPEDTALRVTKNTVALSVARVSVPLFSFILVVYAARILGANSFGKYVLVQTYFQLFLGLCANGLSVVVTREIARRPSWLNRYLSASIILVSVLALIANSLLVILAHVFHYAPDTQAAVYLVSLALLPATVSFMFEGAFVAFEKAQYVTYGTVLENTLRVVFSIVALFKGHGLLALFGILVATRTLMLLFYLPFLNRHVSKLRWYFEWAFLRQLVRDWRVFALENWLFSVFYRLNPIFLSFFHGELAVGPYGAAYKVLNPGSVLAYSFTRAMFPYMSRTFEESRETFRRVSEEVLKYMLVIVLSGVVVIAILADRLVVLLYTDAYADSIPILGVLIWILVPQFLSTFLSHILFARGEQTKALQVAAISLAFNLAISLWLIPRWGGIGAAWALLLAECAAFCLYFVFALRGEGAMHMLLTFGRTVPAAVGVGVFILVLRDIQLVLLLSSAIVLYVLLLLIFRVPSSSDVKLFRRIALKGLCGVYRILGRA